MSIRFAINGVGRIGRALIRVASQRTGLQLVAFNDLADSRIWAHLLAHDSLHGTFPGPVDAAEGCMIIDDRSVVAWYDNEWGHASRLADLLEYLGESLICWRRATNHE